MESPPHDLIHDVVDKHGLETIFRLMTKPRIHKPMPGNICATHYLQQKNNTTTRSPDESHCRLPHSGVEGASVPTPTAISMATKTKESSKISHGDKLSTASTPTLFALTEMQERRMRRDMGLRESRTEIAKMLENMQPIVVKRLPIIKKEALSEDTSKDVHERKDTRTLSNANATVGGEEERESSPTLSSTTTTSHSSITPEVPPICMDASAASPPPLLTASAHHYTCTRAPLSNAGRGKDSETRELAAAAAAVEALLTLSRVIPPSLIPNNKRPRALWEKVEVGVQGWEADAARTGTHVYGEGGGGDDENGKAPLSVQQQLPNIQENSSSAPSQAMPLDSNANANENSAQRAELRDTAGGSLLQLVPARHKRSSPSSRRDHIGSLESRAGAPRRTSKVSRHTEMRGGVSGGFKLRENGGAPLNSGTGSNAGASSVCVDQGASLAWSLHTAAAELLLCAAATAAVTSQAAAAAATDSARGSYKCSRCGQPKKGHRCTLPPNHLEGTSHDLEAVSPSPHSAQSVVQRAFYNGAGVKLETAGNDGVGEHGTSGGCASAAGGVFEGVAPMTYWQTPGKHSKEAQDASQHDAVVEQDSFAIQHVDVETSPNASTTSSMSGPSRQPTDKKNQNASAIRSGGGLRRGIQQDGARRGVKQEGDGHGECLEAQPATAAAVSPVMAHMCVSAQSSGNTVTAGSNTASPEIEPILHLSEQTDAHKRRKKNSPRRRSTERNSPPIVQDSPPGDTPSPEARAAAAPADLPLTSPRTAAGGALTPRNKGGGQGHGGSVVSNQMALFLAGCHTSSSSLRARREDAATGRDLDLEGCGGA